MDIHQEIHKRVYHIFVRTSIRTFIEVCQLLTDTHRDFCGCPSEHSWTSVSFYADANQDSVDVHHFYGRNFNIYGSSLAFIRTHTRTLNRMYIRIYTAATYFICSRQTALIMTSIRTTVEFHQNIRLTMKTLNGHPSACIRMSLRSFIDVCQLGVAEWPPFGK